MWTTGDRSPREKLLFVVMEECDKRGIWRSDNPSIKIKIMMMIEEEEQEVEEEQERKKKGGRRKEAKERHTQWKRRMQLDSRMCEEVRQRWNPMDCGIWWMLTVKLASSDFSAHPWEDFGSLWSEEWQDPPFFVLGGKFLGWETGCVLWRGSGAK